MGDAMKAYLGIKYHADHRNRATIGDISQILEACGFETACVLRDIEKWGAVQMTPHTLMAATLALIRSCQVVVLDLTEKGVGLGIEAGYAHAHRLPIITIAQNDSDISTTLQGISTDVCLYHDMDDLRNFFQSLKSKLN